MFFVPPAFQLARSATLHEAGLLAPAVVKSLSILTYHRLRWLPMSWVKVSPELVVGLFHIRLRS